MERNEVCYRKIIGEIGTALLFFLLFINVTAVIYAAMQQIGNALIPSDVAREVTVQLVYGACYLASFMIPAGILRHRLNKKGLNAEPMRLSPRISPWLPLLVFSLLALIWTASEINQVFVNVFHYSAFSSEYIWGSADTDAFENYQIILEFIVMCLVPGFCEEFLFRGAILSNCRRFGRGNAILISAFLFGMMHENAEQIFYAFIAGIFLGLVYEMTGSIWNCVILHTINNFASTFEAVIFARFSQTFSILFVSVFEAAVYLVGILSILFLVIRFFAKKDDLRDGIFGREIPVSDSYAEYRVTGKRAARLFLTPTMTVFLAFCVFQILLLVGMSLGYGMA